MIAALLAGIVVGILICALAYESYYDFSSPLE